MTRSEALLVTSAGILGICGVCGIGGTVIGLEARSRGLFDKSTPTETPISPAVLASLTPLAELPTATSPLQVAPICAPTETQTPTPTATQIATEVKPTVAATRTPTRLAVATTNPGKNLTCEQVTDGGKIFDTKFSLPTVRASELKYPSKEGSQITPFMASVVKDPGVIVFDSKDKGNADLQKVVDDGYAYWIAPGENQFVLPNDQGQVALRETDGYAVVAFGEGIIKYGDNEYLFGQDDSNGRRGYIAIVRVDGRTDKTLQLVNLRCVVGGENKVQLYPKGLTISEGNILQMVDRMHLDAKKVTVVTIDPVKKQVIGGTQIGNGGAWTLEPSITNVK